MGCFFIPNIPKEDLFPDPERGDRRPGSPWSSLALGALTFLVLFFGDHSHGHGARKLGFPTMGQAGHLHRAEDTLEGVLRAGVPLVAIPPPLPGVAQPVVHLEANHIPIWAIRAPEEREQREEVSSAFSSQLHGPNGVGATPAPRRAG